MKLHIIKYRNVWFAVSSALAALSIGAIAFYGLRFGIDFTGGSLLEAKMLDGQVPAVEEIRAVVAAEGVNDFTVQPIGDDGLLLRLPNLDETGHQELLTVLKEKYSTLEEQRFEAIGPTVGNELRQKAVWSILLVLLGIGLYIAFAFRKVSRPVASWKYGAATLIAALAHDVLLPIGVMAALGHYLNVEINSAFIAAILTVLGFSVHDTIVVFDRIRENLLKTTGSFEDIVDRSVNETLARSINTSLTSLIPMLAIFFFGGETLKWFALTLIVGLTAGTYSSIFLCSPLLVVFQKKAAKK